jgi:hypothetical protein
MSEFVDFSIGNNAILSYKRLDYKIWFALSEFVDNSLQSYRANEKILNEYYKESKKKFEVSITTDRKKSITIRDNSIGMDLSELKKALQIAQPPSDTSGLSEFGMGLKTASCWLGDKFSILTKKYGSEFSYKVEFDVNDVAGGKSKLEITSVKDTTSPSGTTIEISKLHKTIASNTETKIIDYLSNIYRVDIRENRMQLWWNGKEIKYDEELIFWKAADGTPYKKNIQEFTVNGKKVTGWLGIFDEGAGGRNKAGIAVIRRGRCIQSQPNAWMPLGLFGEGYEGTNSLVAQRLFGEINLDDFDVSHTKNAILFHDDEEDEISSNLLKQFSDYKSVAGTPYKKLKEDPNMKKLQEETAQEKLANAPVTNFVLFEDVPTEKVVKENKAAAIKELENVKPNISIQYKVDNELMKKTLTVDMFIDPNKSRNDEYLLIEYPNDEKIIVVINNSHPYYQNAIGDDPVVNHLVSAAADALAEWKCRFQADAIKPDTIRLLKDGILRAIQKVN